MGVQYYLPEKVALRILFTYIPGIQMVSVHTSVRERGLTALRTTWAAR